MNPGSDDSAGRRLKHRFPAVRFFILKKPPLVRLTRGENAYYLTARP